MPRYAILRHDDPRGLHWDLLLETGETLSTWSLPQPPEPGAAMTCRALPDHRLDYLQYEGPVSGDRGSVVRWDHGTYELVSRSDSEWIVELAGEKLVGRATLERSAEGPQLWRLSFSGR